MNRRLYAVLTGIDDYPEKPLSSCIDDVENVNNYLTGQLKHFDLRIKMLKNSEATRHNIIKLFHEHLCEAGANDVVLFYFSGHGSRCCAPKEFEEYEPDGSHETLVCYDSRTEDGWDLADKELAVLFSKVATTQPHILAILDSCYSGSGVKDVNDFYNSGIPKYKEKKPGTRPLESYLDGYFIENGIKVPKSEMALMAACDKREVARQDVFTTNLFKVLRESGRDISYADLFLRTRTTVLNRFPSQTPQLECLERFNAYGTFLDGRIHSDSHCYRIYNKNNYWFINCGAIHGVPRESGKEVKIVVYDFPKSNLQKSSASEIELHGHAVHVDMQESKIELESEHLLDTSKEYHADIITLPVPPLNVCLKGDPEGIREIQAFSLKYESEINFVEQSVSAIYEVICKHGSYIISDRSAGRCFPLPCGYTGENVSDLFSRLMRIKRWERILKLENSKTDLKPAEVDFVFYEIKDNGEELKHSSNEIVLNYSEDAEGIRCALKVRNRSDQTLFFTLLYLSPDFSIYNWNPCDENPPGDREIILDNNHALNIPEKTLNEVIDNFLLLATTERVGEFIFTQEGIGKKQGFKDAITVSKIYSDWFVKSISVRTVR